ncbi:hypothetical protein TorRG33x02_083360 [Trema orientale]|uniref:Uncharacterized protein n=1 Tax=Trema orientale TaxID=63057 RepID=A0A2P5FDE4_TREOI|nr:hypothetical protein TorRG33x02_083360 [Trema orientale]
MAAAGFHRGVSPVLVPILVLLLLLIQYGPSQAINQRSANSNNNQIPSCSDMASESQCSRNPKCRWCRSDALDDMCFSKNEASRLPQMVFSCTL